MNSKQLIELRHLLDIKRQRASKLKEKTGATQKEKDFSSEELRMIELVNLLISSHHTIDLHKPTPFSKEEEDTVIGMLLLCPAEINSIPYLKAKHFHQVSHQNIFTALKQLAVLGGPIDLVMITTQLRKAGRLQEVGGAYLIAQLQGKVSGTATLAQHAAIVFEFYLRRKAITSASEMIYGAYDETCDILDLLNNSIQDFAKMLPEEVNA